MKKRIKEYDVLRIVLTLLVVFGHSAYLNIASQYGGIYYENYLISAGHQLSFSYKIFVNIVNFIYTFHMELFMFLSGALFLYEVKKNSFRELAIKKLNRIIKPFMIVLIFVIVIKFLTGYWQYSNSIFKDIVVGQLLLQGNIHLWFLPTLFFIIIISYFLRRLKINKKVVLMVLFALSVIHPLIPIKIVQYICRYLFWFNIGSIFEKHRNSFNKYNKKGLIIIELIFAILLYALYGVMPGYIRLMIKPCIAGVMVVATYSMCYYISKKWNKNNNVILDESFNIYLFSDPINYIFLYLAFSCLPLDIFSNNICSILFIVSRFLVQLGLSIVVSQTIKLIKKRTQERADANA